MNKKVFFSLTAFFIAVEQIIKVIINGSYLKSDVVLIENFLHFRPMFNRDYSWINSLFNLGVSKFAHIFLVSFIVIGVFLVYRYIDHKGLNTKTISTAFSFLLAGGVCSWIDKIFWDGSLDYIYVVNHFTFDLKDVYVDIFIGLMIIMFIFDHKGFRTADSDHMFKDFFNFTFKRK